MGAITRGRLAGLGLGLLVVATPACAQDSIFAPENFEGSVDLRAIVADGERSWEAGEFGKTRASGDGAGNPKAKLVLASADLAWQPQLAWNLSARVSVTHQAHQHHGVDLNEAYLAYRTAPAPTRLTTRLGLFWPPVSQEHGGSRWLVEDTITPSAINSWIGEEVKVVGAEAKLEQHFGEHAAALTVAIFKHDDMAGTLLSYRGWALHDVRVAARGRFPLPPLSAMIAPYQAPFTDPLWEKDRRVGWYARLDWTPPTPLTLNLTHFDNRGDGVSAYRNQTPWRTHFWNAGMMVNLSDVMTARAQAMSGKTSVGPDTPVGYPVDVGFQSAYLLFSRQLVKGRATVRGDWFRTKDNSFVAADDNREHGWSATAAFRQPLMTHAELVTEVLHVSSWRPSRVLAGVAPRQSQTVVQSALRISF